MDSYAFGIIMYEALQLTVPWSLDFPGNQFVYPIYNSVLKGRRPLVRKEIGQNAPAGFCDLMRQCYAQDKKARPDFNMIGSAVVVFVMFFVLV